MSLPPNIRVNVGAPFPARVQGAGFISVLKANGIWTVAPDFTVLTPLLPGFDPTAWSVAVENLSAKTFASLKISAIAAAGLNAYRMVVAVGDVTIGGSDIGIMLKKTVPAATQILLPASAGRGGVPVWVKDYGYNSAANNIKFVAAGTETLDGFSSADAATNGVALIDINGESKMFWPLSDGTGWYLR